LTCCGIKATRPEKPGLVLHIIPETWFLLKAGGRVPINHVPQPLSYFDSTEELSSLRRLPRNVKTVS
jgi:hypothetical protein